ncbi:hypothetical protein [Streptomyces sp. V4I2]|uniref:hypothetical protein n=1 Tax=Streptomyces sp. V4I2 TaxID=3042280 RepID=UPI002783905C|nr:hypothetical protein [Streptomyces sp. V4I2]MDQ1045768.1 hypothetical protein [Streptomyces sp. V4I2]
MEFSQPDRLFKVWDYSVTHRTLRLRSDAYLDLEAGPRIEVVAGHVDVMFLRSTMRGLTIRRVSSTDEVEAVAERYGITEDLDYMFLLESADGPGLIMSGNPSWAMADCPIDAPSLFSRAGEVNRYPDGVMGQID